MPGTPPLSGAYPTDDLEKPDDTEDELRTPDPVGARENISIFNMRGFANILVVTILLGLITLFIVYRVLTEKNIIKQSYFLFGTNDGGGNSTDTNTDPNTDPNANKQQQTL